MLQQCLPPRAGVMNSGSCLALVHNGDRLEAFPLAGWAAGVVWPLARAVCVHPCSRIPYKEWLTPHVWQGCRESPSRQGPRSRTQSILETTKQRNETTDFGRVPSGVLSLRAGTACEGPRRAPHAEPHGIFHLREQQSWNCGFEPPCLKNPRP